MAISTDDHLENTLKEIVVSDLYIDVPANEISVDDGLRDVLGLDSLGFIELRTQCEQRFGISITDADFDPTHFHSLRTVASLVRHLRREHDVVPSQ